MKVVLLASRDVRGLVNTKGNAQCHAPHPVIVCLVLSAAINPSLAATGALASVEKSVQRITAIFVQRSKIRE